MYLHIPGKKNYVEDGSNFQLFRRLEQLQLCQ